MALDHVLQSIRTELQSITLIENNLDSLQLATLKLQGLFLKNLLSVTNEELPGFYRALHDDQRFLNIFRAAPTVAGQEFPLKMLQQYESASQEFPVKNLLQNPTYFISKLAVFLKNNLRKNNELHNSQVIKFLLKTFNSSAFNTLIIALMKEHPRNTSILQLLYLHCIWAIYVLGAVLIPLSLFIGSTVFGMAVLFIDSIVSTLVKKLRNNIERPLLNLLSSNQYDLHVEKYVKSNLTKDYRETSDAFVWINATITPPLTEDEAQKLTDKIWQTLLTRRFGRAPTPFELSRERSVCNVQGLEHHTLVIQSLYAALTHSISSDQSKILTILTRTLRLLCAIPTVAFVTLPLVLVNTLTNMLENIYVALVYLTGFIATVAVFGIHSLEHLPQIFYPRREPTADLQDAALEKTSKNWSKTLLSMSQNSFFQSQFPAFINQVEQTVRIPKLNRV